MTVQRFSTIPCRALIVHSNRQIKCRMSGANPISADNPRAIVANQGRVQSGKNLLVGFARQFCFIPWHTLKQVSCQRKRLTGV